MREFLVEIRTTFPEGTAQEEIDRLRTAEAVRARELAAGGQLARLWRPAGELRSVGLWRAADEDELREKALGTLPLARTWPPRTTLATWSGRSPGSRARRCFAPAGCCGSPWSP